MCGETAKLAKDGLVHKRSERKWDDNFFQIRLSAPAAQMQAIKRLASTHSYIGTRFTIGISICVVQTEWVDLRPKIAGVKWRGKVYQESPKWVPIPCHHDRSAILTDLQPLRGTSWSYRS